MQTILDPHHHISAARALLKSPAPLGISLDNVCGLTSIPRPQTGLALEKLRQAADIAPEDPRLLHDLGTLELEEGNITAGLKALEAAVGKSPRYEWILELAAAHRRPHPSQSLSRALELYEEAFWRNPKDPKARSGIINLGLRGPMDWGRIWRQIRLTEVGRKKSPYLKSSFRQSLDFFFHAEYLSEENVAFLFDAIEEEAVENRLLHPMTLSLIASRAEFAGELRLGSALRKKAAQRRASRMLQASLPQLSSITLLLSALLYLRREKEAGQVLDEIEKEAEDADKQRQLSKLRADIELLKGDHHPYIEYSERARRELPLNADSAMEALIKGRRVAIVGPADTGDTFGDVIDSFDVVVRTNFDSDFVRTHRTSMGSRTDIAYYSGRDLASGFERISESVAQGELKLVVGRMRSYYEYQHLDVPWLRFYRHEFPLYFHGQPLGVQRMCYDLLQFDPAEICLFNTDFYTGQFTVGYREASDTVFGPGSVMNDLIVNHDLSFDFTFTQALRQADVLTAAGKAAEVLSLSLDEYLQRLEQAENLWPAKRR